MNQEHRAASRLIHRIRTTRMHPLPVHRKTARTRTATEKTWRETQRGMKEREKEIEKENERKIEKRQIEKERQ